ncbi:hypothetical protein [Chroococcidiopsis sp.]|uniref:hypothetical protein n=1 Tax=Chroococcidiopsis sp. TaxID=3088168 RepID=UPI003F2AFE14
MLITKKKIGDRRQKRAGGVEGATQNSRIQNFPTPHTPHPTPFLHCQPSTVNYHHC